jgi:hypothetical protein
MKQSLSPPEGRQSYGIACGFAASRLACVLVRHGDKPSGCGKAQTGRQWPAW